MDQDLIIPPSPSPKRRKKHTSKASSQPWVPVVSSTGKPLMPCRPARARRLIEQGRAVKRWRNRIFYIQLLDREDGVTQPVAVGIDPGSKREAFTVKANHRTFLNLHIHAIDGEAIKKALEERRNLRRSRRYRSTPCRQPRQDRLRGNFWVPPSTRARWQLKLNILKWLSKLYPITDVIIEDVKAVTREGKKRWNSSFSPVQAGKNWFYTQLRLLGYTPILVSGTDTANLRELSGLTKTSNKLAEVFEAHCVDSWVLANSVVGGHTTPDMTKIYTLKPLRTSRRQLHRCNPQRYGVRPRYGGTMSLGVKKFTMVKDPKRGLCLVGGNNGNNRVSLHSIDGYFRLCQNANPENLQLISYAPWLLRGNRQQEVTKRVKKAELNTKLIEILYRNYNVPLNSTKFNSYQENLEILRRVRCSLAG